MLNTADTMNIEYPKLYRVRQHLEKHCIVDVRTEVYKQMDKIGISDGLKGKRIAITAGSRGICNIDSIIKSLVDYVWEHGGKPFIVPAMGSHGGATAEGQTEVLKGYGITEETMGCPIRSSMETVYLGETENGAPVYFDKIAYESDGVIVCNRVKPHTDFSADNESGIVKMIAIGLGKEKGCSSMHAHGLAKTIPLSAKISLEKAPILCGLAIVENSCDQTYLLEGIKRENFIEEDARLLKLSKELVPHLPDNDIDLLIVKEIGKIYSGTGMDTKVIGRIKVRGEKEPDGPDVKMLVALRMNEHSYGNALGIGLADITTKALVDKIDRQSMYSNLIATTFLERGKIPVYFDTEKESIEKAMTVLMRQGDVKRIIIVDNTLQIETMIVSEEIYKAHEDRLERLEDVHMIFDAGGRLSI